MTYRTLLTFFDGLWIELYLMRSEFEGSMRIKVAELLAGHAATTVKEPKAPTMS